MLEYYANREAKLELEKRKLLMAKYETPSNQRRQELLTQNTEFERR